MMDYTKAFAAGTQKVYDEGLRSYMLKIYSYMGMALLLSALADYLVTTVPALRDMIFQFTPSGQMMGNTGLGTLLMFAPVGIAIYFFWGIGTLSFDKARVLFWVYAFLTGMSFASLSFVYTGESIARTFLVCSATFGAVSIYGYSTQKDLTSIGSFCTMGLIGLIITIFINMFLRSPAIEFATSIIGVAIFIGLIAWDTQKLKGIYYSSGGGEAGQKLAIVGAFTLYLDFINLFLYLLRFFGQQRRN